MPRAMETDTEMGDSETPAGPPDRPVNGSDQSDASTELISHARQLINQGKPTLAFQAVVLALRTRGGDEAVFQALDRAREAYRIRLHESAAADQLASLFAECAIAEAQPRRAEPSPSSVLGGHGKSVNAYGTSILAETGRTQIVVDAFSDGSSFICLRCGGVVALQRKDEHYAYCLTGKDRDKLGGLYKYCVVNGEKNLRNKIINGGVKLWLEKSTGLTKTGLHLLENITDIAKKEDSVFFVASKRTTLDECKVPVGIRVFVSASHSEADLRKAVESLKRVTPMVLKESV